MWVWVLIIGLVGLGIYLSFTLRDIWHSLKRLYGQVEEFSEAFSNFSPPSDRAVEPISDVYGDPTRLEYARRDRIRISEVRATARRRRFDQATGRWEEITDASFSSIGPEERERARTRVDRFRS